MISTVVKSIAIIGILTSATIFSILNPITLTEPQVNAMVQIFQTLWGLDGLLPIDAIMEAIFLDISIFVLYIIFKLIMGLIALFAGTGKPEID